jgi:hypothetical protein
MEIIFEKSITLLPKVIFGYFSEKVFFLLFISGRSFN